MWKLLKLLIVVAVLAVGWWLLSPLFIDKQVNEDIDPRVKARLTWHYKKPGRDSKKPEKPSQHKNARYTEENCRNERSVF